MSLFAGQSREQLRAVYREAWRKWREQVPLQPLEAQIADVIRLHPEYQPLLDSEAGLDTDFPVEAGRTNPFLHLSLHLAVREQIRTDRPRGIAAIYRQLTVRLDSEHAAEHCMLEPLAETLWEAQRSGTVPDEAVYLEMLKKQFG